MTDTKLVDAAKQLGPAAEADLLEWLRIPSISSDPAHNDATLRAGQWAADKLRSLGLEVEVVPTDGHPLVLAETPPVPGAPVALVYGHYDVQPVEPLEEWRTPPFEPDIRDGNVYARGATDDKGQVLTHIESLAAWREAGDPLPLQLKFLLEGEEEVGSHNLEQRLPDLAERLACDVVVISDNSQLGDGRPAITYGLRGITTFELKVLGPRQDLHSGAFGGAVMNPAIALARMLSSIVDAEGRVQLPGFYDDVRALSEYEREQLAELEAESGRLTEQLGVPELFGERGYGVFERRWTRPTFDINGLTSGHQGPGVKTIIPATASAKLSFRLVPDQDPERIEASLRQHLEAVCPSSVRYELTGGHRAPGMVARLDSPYITAAAQAVQAAFGTEPVLIREGGSIPIVARFQEVLGADCLLLGWGLDDDNTHSPNEKFRIADFHRGMTASALLWRELGKVAL